MRVTAEQFREEVLRILDHCLEGDEPIEIEYRGRLLRLEPMMPSSKLARLTPRPFLATDPDDLVHHGWVGDP